MKRGNRNGEVQSGGLEERRDRGMQGGVQRDRKDGEVRETKSRK